MSINGRKPKILDTFNMDTIQVPDGYYMTSKINVTEDNIIALVDEHNNMVKIVNVLLAHTNIVIEE